MVLTLEALFFLISWLIWKYGSSIKVFIEKRFNILALAFTIIVVVGFVLIKFMGS